MASFPSAAGTTSESARQNRSLVLLCAIIYFVSYITRNNYGSAINEITAALGTTREWTALVSTAAFLTYGSGQIISGILGDRFSPRLVIASGLCITAVCNLAMPLVPDVRYMIVLWGINGFAQALFWPPIVRILAEQLDADGYKHACVVVSVASSVGNILVYLLSPLCITLFGWRLIFWVSSTVAIASILLWWFGTRRLQSQSSRPAETNGNASSHTPAQDPAAFRRALTLSGFFIILLPILFQGMLRDGLTTWMPSLVQETFQLPSTVSILTGVVLPIFAVISFEATAVFEKKVGNELKCAGILFLAALVASLLLLPLLSVSAAVCVLLTAIITACMHGINLLLITLVPAYFGKYGKIATISGILNAFTYLGSALSTYGFAVLSTKYGWYFTILSWAVLSALGAVSCLLLVPRWCRFTDSQ